MLRAIPLLLGAWVLVTSTASRAADWRATFPAARAATHLKRTGLRVLVAAAGEHAETRGAASALESALRVCGRTQLVISDQPLGRLGQLDDRAVVARGRALPVDAIAVVRVFPGADAASPSVVVVLYDREGNLLGAMSGKAGSPIAAAAAEPAASGLGVPSAAVASVTKVNGAEPDRSAAQLEYDRRFIGLEQRIGITVGQYGGTVYTFAVPYQGKHRRPLEGALFYEALGRHDLVHGYRVRRGTKLGLLLGGIALQTAGLAIATWGLIKSETDECESLSSSSGHCYSYRRDLMNGRTVAGLVMMGVGMSSWLAGLFIRRDPIPAHEAHRLVDEHNQLLKRRLGLGARAPSTARQLALDGAIVPGGGGLRLAMRF